MTRWAFFLACLLTPVICSAQAMQIQAGRTARLPVAGATAAFSLNSVYADATVEEGAVIVSARRPGSTNIVVVTAVGTQTFEVVVLEPPPNFPPGFVGGALTGSDAETSSYEFRYSSVPIQQQNVIDIVRRENGRSFRLHVANANVFAPGRDADDFSTRVPLAFYEVETPRRKITVLDQQVIASPLTVENALVRGLHVREGRWTFHGGYSSLSAFQGLFLPIDREAVLGASYGYRLNPRSRLEASLYAFPGHRRGAAGVTSGLVGSLLYEYKRRNDVTVLAEAGASRGPGFAFRIDKTRRKGEFRSNVRYRAAQFAGLSVDSNHGLLADGVWRRPISRQFELNASYFANRYILPQFRETNLGTSWMLKYDTHRHWAFSAGAQYAHLKPDLPPGTGVESASLPLGVEFRWSLLSAGYRHAFTRNTAQDLGGHEDGANAGAGFGSWRLNAFFDRQTEAPTAHFVVSQTPGLREVIDRLGIEATSAEQIARLVRQDAVLLELGYVSAIHLNVEPVRVQAGGNLVWAGRGRRAPQLTASFLYNHDEFVSGESRSRIGTLSFACRLSARMDLFASWSRFSTSSPATPAQRRSLLDLSVRQRFARAPGWLFPGRRGTISGRVFQDDEQAGEWRATMNGLRNVVVVLDGTRYARTRPDGSFLFSGVTTGTHEVEVMFESDKPFYFSTPSRRTVAVNSRADFGIVYATSMLVGRVLNDAGTGIPGVQVGISGAGRRLDTTTDGEGKFSLSGLAPGEYEVAPNPDSFAPGYLLTDLAAQRAEVHGHEAGRIEFTVPAMRALAGTVHAYDRTLTRQVPVEGVVVRLRELNLEATTGRDGTYVFRDLPAGAFTVVVLYGGREVTLMQRLPPEPVFIRNANIDLGAR